MQPLNINTVILRPLISFGIVMTSLYAIQVLPASAQSSASERIDCIKKFKEYYYSFEGGHLSASNALAKAEQTCAEESNNKLNVQQQPPFIFIPNPSVQQFSPEKFAQCVNQQMYKQKEVCIDPWGRMDETCFFRGTGGKKTVSEPTGITLEQASSTCGG